MTCARRNYCGGQRKSCICFLDANQDCTGGFYSTQTNVRRQPCRSCAKSNSWRCQFYFKFAVDWLMYCFESTLTFWRYASDVNIWWMSFMIYIVNHYAWRKSVESKRKSSKRCLYSWKTNCAWACRKCQWNLQKRRSSTCNFCQNYYQNVFGVHPWESAPSEYCYYIS